MCLRRVGSFGTPRLTVPIARSDHRCRWSKSEKIRSPDYWKRTQCLGAVSRVALSQLQLRRTVRNARICHWQQNRRDIVEGTARYSSRQLLAMSSGQAGHIDVMKDWILRLHHPSAISHSCAPLPIQLASSTVTFQPLEPQCVSDR